MNNFSDELKNLFQERLKENELLSKHTNFRIGGPARWFIEAKNSDEVFKAIQLAGQSGIKWFVMGGGSNTLASDTGFDGLVVQLAMRNYKIEGTTVMAEAGVPTGALARATAEAGLAGFEWAVTLPGTIGGAVRGNAGCFGGEMKDTIKEVAVLRDGKPVTLNNHEMNFGYRDSAIKHSRDIVISVTLELKPGDPIVLKTKIEELIAKRKASQPFYGGSAGCVFKNYKIRDGEIDRIKQDADIPPEMLAKGQISAGWLIEQMDLKGKQIDGAKISEEHGNFIVNTGDARADDVMQLISIVKMNARDRFGIQLEEEVEYLGF
ncbi:MAG: UDP-N-acetylmuramate dehydrogenase [Patescibacteria group bacterium]|jgi:UDP-N-acetylmuramate dehydrogenase